MSKPSPRAIAASDPGGLRGTDGECGRRRHRDDDGGAELRGLLDHLHRDAAREHDSAGADDYVDEPGRGEEWKLVQRDAEREWRNAGIYVVDCFGKLALFQFREAEIEMGGSEGWIHLCGFAERCFRRHGIASMHLLCALPEKRLQLIRCRLAKRGPRQNQCQSKQPAMLITRKAHRTSPS